MKSIAKVVVGLPVDGPFDYAVPETLRDSLCVGQRVVVPFGKREITGYITDLADQSDLQELKEIVSADGYSLLPPELMELSAWMSKYYGCSQGEAIETMLPFALRKRKRLPLRPLNTSGVKSADVGRINLYLSHDRDAAFSDIEQKIKTCLSRGEGVLLLAPDAAHMKKMTRRFLEILDQPLVCLSHDSSKEQNEIWLALRNGQFKFAIGLRQAVFAPVRNLGLVVMFAEDHYGYQEDQTPFYHARDVLLKRAETEKFDVIFSSAAPSVELWSMFEEYPERVKYFEKELSKMRLIDLTNYKPGRQSFLSFPLANSISTVLEKGGRVVIIHNRRGFHTYTKCAECGHVLACPRCGVPYTFMFESRKMVCSSCGHSEEPTKKCPQCRKEYLKSYGEGIERVESDLARFFPQASLATFDKDTRAIPKQANLIIATQAILKIIEKLPVNLIVILDGDAALSRFNFRAHQKVFSFLMEMRLYGADELVVQTRNPLQHTLQCAMANDLKRFYNQEISSRQELKLPPKGHLLLILFRGKDEVVVTEQVDAVYEYFQEHGSDMIDVFPPQQDFQPKLRDKYRLMIMIKTEQVEAAVSHVKDVLKNVKRKRGVIVTVQVDP